MLARKLFWTIAMVSGYVLVAVLGDFLLNVVILHRAAYVSPGATALLAVLIGAPSTYLLVGQRFDLTQAITERDCANATLRRASRQATDALASLSESEQKLRGLFELAPVGIALTAMGGRFADFNEAFRRISGYRREELLELDYWRLTPPGYAEQEDAQLSALACAGRYGPYEKEYIHKDGSRVPIRLSGMLIEAPNGEKFIWSIVEDISEQLKNETALVEARDRAEAAAAAEAEFLANMTHELRTPLNAITGFAGILARSPSLTAEDAGHAARILDASKVLLALVNDILDFSRLDGAAIELEREPCDPRDLVRAVAALMAEEASDRGLDLDVRFDGEPRLVVGDAIRIRQVLTNFVPNALKFTPSGAITIAVACAGVDANHVSLRIAVSDTGIGIAPEKIERLFDRFTQADASTSRRYGGTGLGLAISKQIVDLMGGRIGCDSHLGEGSTFWFEVVLPTAGAASVATPADESACGPAAALRVLLVEDVAVNRELIGALLAPFEIEIETAENGQQALDAVCSRQFDIVLMDVQMPVMDGLAATRAVRALEEPAARSVPIIAMTANVLPHQVQKCLDAGMDDHLGKPIDPQALFAALNRWSAGRAAARDAAA